MTANGSTPWHQTSWPLVQESANLMGAPADVAVAALINAGLPTGPTDRLPFDVVADALIEHGYEPQKLTPVFRPGL